MRGYKICFGVCLLVIGAFVSAFQYTPPSGGGGAAVWGSITGTLSNQTDLNTALGLKATSANAALTGTATASGIFNIGDPVSVVPFWGGQTPATGMTFLGNGGEFIGSGLNDLEPYTNLITYTGSAPAVFIFKISSTGTPDNFTWAKDNGSFSSPIAITGGPQTISEGLVVRFLATTGHTSGDIWLIPTAAGLLWPTTLSEIGKSGGSAALAGAGAGNVTNGAHAVKYTWATNQGDTYAVSVGTVTVTNNATNGQITVSGIAQSTSALFIGANIWMTHAGGSTYYLAGFAPKGNTSFTINRSDGSLTSTAPYYFDNITTAGGCIYGEIAGLTTGSCALQIFDYGARFPLGGAGRAGAYFFDGFANGILGTVGNLLTQFATTGTGTTVALSASPAFTGTPTAPTASASDNSTKIATTAYADRAATNAGGSASPPYVTIGGTPYGPIFAVTQPPTSSWTFTNGGSSTATTVNASVLVDFFPNLGVGNLRSYTRSLPATSGYTVIMGVLSSSAFAGPCISDGTKYLKLATASSSKYQYESWNSTSSISTFPSITNYPLSFNSWYRIQDTGGNRTWSVSPDGLSWVQVQTDATHTFLTETVVGLCSYTDQVPHSPMVLYSYTASAP
jgi:hypothetical protein